MNVTLQIQRELFDRIKAERNADQKDWVEELEKVLHVSKDAVYRRLRGDTLLTLEDLRHLADHYKVSLDQLLHIDYQTVVTSFQSIPAFTLEKFLHQILQNLQSQASKGPIQILFNARELPIFYLLQFPDLLAFKYYFWSDTFLHNGDANGQPFSRTSISVESRELSREILDVYQCIDSMEIWSLEIIHATVEQIAYYQDIGCLGEEERSVLYESIFQLVDWLEKQVANGSKEARACDGGRLDVYWNEVLPGDNTLIVKHEDHLVTFLTQQVVNSVIIEDPIFCENTLNAMNGIISKSTLISASAEKSRKKFFQKLRKQVHLSMEGVQSAG